MFPGHRFRLGRRLQFTLSCGSCSSGSVVAKAITFPMNSASRIAGPGTPVSMILFFFCVRTALPTWSALTFAMTRTDRRA
jgi:hypothetical protein